MALFAVNTGLRNSNVCGLQWAWEVPVPEIGRSVFVIPADAIKTKRPHVVILKNAAWSIVQAQRGQHPVWVFTYRGHRVGTMNNNGWQQVRREAGLRAVRVHVYATPTPVGCARPEYRPRIVQHYWDMVGAPDAARDRGTSSRTVCGARSSPEAMSPRR